MEFSIQERLNLREASMSHVKAQLIIPAPQMEVFRFATDPDTLPLQLEENIQLKWLNPGTQLRVGAEYSFAMKRLGIEQPVRFRVDRYVVGNSLNYHQIEGIFQSWVHTMKFEEATNGSTLLTDLVDYDMPLGIMGRVIDDVWWKKDLKKILEARLRRIAQHFERSASSIA